MCLENDKRGTEITFWDFFALKKEVPNGPFSQESPWQTKPKKGQFMNFSWDKPEQKFDVNRACFPKEFTKMREIHELFVLALFLAWFAGATPDFRPQKV